MCRCASVHLRVWVYAIGNKEDSPSRVKRVSQQESYNRELAHIQRLSARAAVSQLEIKESHGHSYSLSPNPETQKRGM